MGPKIWAAKSKVQKTGSLARSFYDGVFPHELKKYSLPNREKINPKYYGKILQ